MKRKRHPEMRPGNSVTHAWKRMLVTFLLSLVGFSFGGAETFAGVDAKELFTMAPGSPALNARQERDRKDPTVVRSRYVVVNFDLLAGKNLPEGAETIVLNLFDDVSITATKDRMERRSASQYSWFGWIEGVEQSRAILVVDNGSMAASIQVDRTMYGIYDVRDRIHGIFELDQSAFLPEAPPIPVELPGPKEPHLPSAEADDGSFIDVMIVYTHNVAAEWIIDPLAQLAIDQTNDAYANSGIDQRLRLVHVALVSYAETGTIETDIQRLRDPDDGHMDDVHALRNEYGADCVSLWVENADHGGIAYLMQTVSPFFESSAFSVVQWQMGIEAYSFGHELGHNMSARHDRFVDNTDNSPFTYNHGYVNAEDQWRTIMAYNWECADLGFDCLRIPHWSNPDVEYGGDPMGVEEGQPNAADNRKTLNNTALTVANFRQQIVPSGYWVGDHPTDDFSTIREALEANWVVDGDTIIVRDGTYTGADNKNLDFGGKAITLRSENGPSHCTIDCENNGRGFYFHSGETADSIVDGFSIINGQATGASPDDRGGAIYCENSSPTIRNCSIKNNHSDAGGAIVCWYSSPIISDCRIINNTTLNTRLGGGIVCVGSAPLITGCTISANFAGNGAGVYCENSSPTLTNCVIGYNLAQSYGGGICCNEESSPIITDCTVAKNEALCGGGIFCLNQSSPTLSHCDVIGNTVQSTRNASGRGGGVYCSSSSLHIIDSTTIKDNKAYSYTYIDGGLPHTVSAFGGGIYCTHAIDVIIRDSVIMGNKGSDGGGIYCRYSSATITNCNIIANSRNGIYLDYSSPTITNCTISDNSASRGGGIRCKDDSHPIVTNSILWGNSAPDGPEIALKSTFDPSSLTISYSDVEGGEAAASIESGCTLNWGVGNIDADPLFVDPGYWDGNVWMNGDYHLQACSPGIDAGDPASDFSNEPEPNGYRVNMGAYGNTPEAAPNTGSLLPVPDNLTSQVTSQTTIQLTWDDVAGEDGYRIEGGPDGSVILPPDTTGHEFTDLIPCTEYCFTIVAFNTCGDRYRPKADTDQRQPLRFCFNRRQRYVWCVLPRSTNGESG